MKKRIFNFLAENKWIVASSIFFLLWKFLLVSVLWNHRLSPPKPDDSFVYITHIENIRRCPSVFFCQETIISENHPLFFSHLTYGIFFGSLANILGISSEQIYHLSFYLGTLALLAVLIFFIRNFTNDKRLIAFSIFFLALYNGNGSYHGFFWVVPSFFALLFFFLIFSFLNGEYKHWKTFFLILIPAAIYTHMLALYMIFTLFIFVALKFLTARKMDRNLLKKSVFILLATVAAYFSLSLYFKQKSYWGNHYGVEKVASQLLENIKTDKMSQKTENAAAKNPEKKAKAGTGSSFSSTAGKPQTVFEKNSCKRVENNYFKWIFLNFFGFASFATIIILLVFYGQFDLLLLYLSSLIFVLVSLPFQYGYRSLILIWPATFLLYAFGSWYALKFAKEKIKSKFGSNAARVLIVIAILVFVSVNMTYSYYWNRYSNEDADFNLNPDYAKYVQQKARTGKRLMYGTKLLNSIEGLNGLRSFSKTNKIENAAIFVSLANTDKKYDSSDLNGFLEFFSQIMGVNRVKTPTSASAQNQYLKDNFYLSKKFGDIEIYERR